MKKSTFIHFGWAFVALAAFFLGSQLFGKKGESNKDTTNQSTTQKRLLHSDHAQKAGSQSASRNSDSASRSNSKRTLTEADITILGDKLRSAKGPIERRFAFTKILEALTPENAKLLREQIVHLDQNSSEFREFHYAWGSMAGQEAVLHGEDTPKKDMASTLAGWMNADPDAALAYFNSLPENLQNGGGDLKWGAVYGLSDHDPTRAAQFISERFEGGDREARRMIRIATDALFRNGEKADIDGYLAAVPEGRLRTDVQQHVARELAESDPVEATTWARNLPEGDGKDRAVGTSFHTWAGRDPVAAAAQINTLTGAERDAATYGYATRVVRDDPATGVEWAATIKDDDSRNRALINTGRIYYRRDREAAKEWLASSGLSPEQQKQVTTRGRRRRR